MPDPLVESLVAYLEGSLSSDNGLDANTRALYVNVLAGFGRPQHGWMARLAELPKALDIAGRANLAAAWFHSGRADRARDALPEGTPELVVESSTGGRITSRVRQEAVLLLALLEIDPDHDWIPALAERVNGARKGRGYWGSTLENATALAALARYQATAHAGADFTGTKCFEVLTENGRPCADCPVATVLETGGASSVQREGMIGGLAIRSRAARVDYDGKAAVLESWSDESGTKVFEHVLAG